MQIVAFIDDIDYIIRWIDTAAFITARRADELGRLAGL